MKKSILPLVLFIFIGLVSPVTQANPLSSSFIQLAQNDQSLKNLNSAVQSVKQKTGGRILSTKTVNNNGQRIHKIKVLLPSGKVQVFSVNAQ